MTLEQHIALCASQQSLIQFAGFNHQDAWQLGNALYRGAEQQGFALAIDITLNGNCLFSALMPGACAENIDWVRRKRNLVNLLGISSWAAGLMLAQRQTTLEARYGVTTRDYAPFGGSYPLQVAGCGMVGSVTVSGAPQRDDHNLVLSTLWQTIGLPQDELRPVPEP